MKTRLLAAAILMASTGLSFAADPMVVVETPAYAAFDWSGAYIGVHGGYGWGDSDFRDSDGFNLFGQSFNVDSDGFIGGVQAGYNFQSGNLVAGVEAELGYLGLDGTDLQEDGVWNDTYGSVDGGLYAGLSGRLGFAMDRTLIYAKGGAVYFDGEYSVRDACNVAPCGVATLSGSKTVGWGYQVGAGVEHAVTNNWTLKLEYAYFDFGKQTVTGIDNLGGAWDYRADLSAHTIKVGANFKF